MTWIQSYGRKYHIPGARGWSLCRMAKLMKEPVDNPPIEKRCKICMKLAEEVEK